MKIQWTTAGVLVTAPKCRVENDTVRLWKGLPRIHRPHQDINFITLIKALSIRPTYVIHTLHNTLIIGQFS